MPKMRIKNDSKVKDILVRGDSPNHQPAKIKKNGGETSKELGSHTSIDFSFYIEDDQGQTKPATCSYFKMAECDLANVSDPVDISIEKNHNETELKLKIDWSRNGKQKSKDLLPPDNVEIGVKE
jgi:hypothetical protein